LTGPLRTRRMVTDDQLNWMSRAYGDDQPGTTMTNGTVPRDPLEFIRRCVRERKIYWTYHVNMRLAGRYLSRAEIVEASGRYQIIESYPEDALAELSGLGTGVARSFPRAVRRRCRSGHRPGRNGVSPRPGRMGNESEVEKGAAMKCRVCGGTLRAVATDLPFKVREQAIVIVKALPVAQCDSCSEYVIADSVFEKVETLLSAVDESAELEIIAFAA
jgi:YgiT-type zinc finger domain-containing protein